VGLSAGVEPGDTVVVDGADKLEEGSRVETSVLAPKGAVTPAPANVATSDSPAPARGGRHRSTKPAKSAAGDH